MGKGSIRIINHLNRKKKVLTTPRITTKRNNISTQTVKTMRILIVDRITIAITISKEIIIKTITTILVLNSDLNPLSVIQTQTTSTTIPFLQQPKKPNNLYLFISLHLLLTQAFQIQRIVIRY